MARVPPLRIVGIGGTTKSASSTEQALVIALASAREAGAASVLLELLPVLDDLGRARPERAVAHRGDRRDRLAGGETDRGRDARAAGASSKNKERTVVGFMATVY